MQKHLYILCAAALAAFISFLSQSCKKYDDSLAGSQTDLPQTERSDDMARISADIQDLTESDAVIVANLFHGSSPLTKSAEKLPVLEIITIKDDNGKPAIYAINYTDGYTLVSATKNHYPILADVEHGHFSMDSGTGQDVLIRDYIQDIECSRAESCTMQRMYWMPYEANGTLDVIKTKVANDDYYDLLETYSDEWARDGRNVYYLKRQPENMPDDLYELFCTIARDDMGDIPGYPYMDCAIITEKPIQYVANKIPPLLETHWKQRFPYNSSLTNTSKPLGCVTIAAGQIMRYHEYPENFNWDLMPNSTSNATLCDFLAELHEQLGVDDFGGASINDAKRVLGGYGYSIRMKNHNASDVSGALNKREPVYMRGTNQKTDEGHAWVCDGATTIQPRMEYKMYELIFDCGEPVRFEEFASETLFEQSYTVYHMNWGWGGLNDGYFYDNCFNLQVNGEDYNFISNRINLLISR